MTAPEVLDVLAQHQEFLGWLANDGRQQLADARLTAFRSEEHFAVFAEFPHFLYLADGFYHWIGCAGNCLQVGDYPLLSRDLPVAEVPDAPLWREDESVHWLADRTQFSVMFQGQRLDFKPSPEDYARAGVVFEDERSGPNTISPGQWLHFLSVSLVRPFFCSEEELRQLIEPSMAMEMSLFLQTDCWQHPKYLVLDENPMFADSLIRNIPCWQILARAIASGDLSEWKRQDISRFNTGWTSLERIYQEENDGYSFD